MALARAEDVVTVFGGSGFLGRDVVRALVAGGHSVRIAVRDPARARRIQGIDEPVGTTFVHADVTDEASVSQALSGGHAAVNSVSAYVEKGGITYSAIHEEGARIVAQQAAKAGLACLVHLSGIGADPQSKSKYIRSRGGGEERVRETFPDAVIVRPSVMFGPDDSFVNTLDQLSRVLPALPVFGAGRTRLQPVFVEDVAAAIVRIVEDSATRGRTFELGGPDVYAYRDLTRLVLRMCNRKRLIFPYPFALARLQAKLAEWRPSAPLTVAQVELLEQDNVASEGSPEFDELGITPRSIEDVAPTYLNG